MKRSIRYGDVVRELTLDQRSLSYRRLTSEIQFDENGNALPYRPEKLRLSADNIYHLMAPYVSVRLLDQVGLPPLSGPRSKLEFGAVELAPNVGPA